MYGIPCDICEDEELSEYIQDTMILIQGMMREGSLYGIILEYKGSIVCNMVMVDDVWYNESGYDVRHSVLSVMMFISIVKDQVREKIRDVEEQIGEGLGFGVGRILDILVVSNGSERNKKDWMKGKVMVEAIVVGVSGDACDDMEEKQVWVGTRRFYLVSE